MKCPTTLVLLRLVAHAAGEGMQEELAFANRFATIVKGYVETVCDVPDDVHEEASNVLIEDIRDLVCAEHGIRFDKYGKLPAGLKRLQE
jgi:hypothetical protein